MKTLTYESPMQSYINRVKHWEQIEFKEAPLTYYSDEKHILKLYSLSSCQYVSTVSEKKTACYRPLKNGHFIRVCTERTMDYQYGGKGARNIYSNYNQMRAYVECFPNQPKTYLIDLSIEQSTKL